MTYQKTRLQIRHERAQERVNAAVAAAEQTQIDIAKERTQFFEKLAIGSGATIAALVSFLGAHSEKLRPPWILRTSLVALVVAIFSALFRNLRYPNYVLSAADIRCWDARIEEQELKRERSMYVESDQPTDAEKTAYELPESTKEAVKLMPKKKSVERRHLKEWKAAEKVCLTAVCVAMVCLVWLALVNF
jgi:hypothetical protein